MCYELPVVIPNQFTATFFYALPLACILADSDYSDWFHSNYIDFYGYKNTVNREKYEFRFVDAVSYVDRYLHKNESVQIDKYDLNFFTCNNLLAFIKDRINSWNYIILYVDENCIPNSPFKNVIHEYLVYGYTESSLQVIGMDSTRHYSKIRLSYETVNNAFLSLLNSGKTKVLYQLCVTNRYTSISQEKNRFYSHHIIRKYSEETFIKKIQAYLEGKITEGPVQILNKDINPYLACGINTLNVFKQYLRDVENGANFEFNVPFFLHNYRQGILQRLNYAYTQTSNFKYHKAAIAYQEIVRLTDLFKNMHIKSMQSYDRHVDKMCDVLENSYDKEYHILSEL